MQKYYSISDLCVIPSRFETLGFVALEAMSMQRPVLASCVGGLPEIVKHGESGILVPPGDVQRLAKSIIMLCKNQKLAESLGHGGRLSVIERFNIDRMVEQTLTVYNEALGISA